jgi:hypothetical protein
MRRTALREAREAQQEEERKARTFWMNALRSTPGEPHVRNSNRSGSLFNEIGLQQALAGVKRKRGPIPRWLMISALVCTVIAGTCMQKSSLPAVCALLACKYRKVAVLKPNDDAQC